MQTLNDALYVLYMNREVTAEECLRVTSEPVEFQRMIGQADPAAEDSGKPAARPPVTRPAPGSPVRR
jgi:twitching motility protein PilT